MESHGFRIGDRVYFRVLSAHPHSMWGDIIGVHAEKLLIGWEDGSKSWELPIELRIAD